MRPIGGELELRDLKENIYYVDSGRSAFRLFIRSGNRNKKYLIPNYFCEIIESILIQEKVKYEFYNVSDDLSIEMKSIRNRQFDVLYIINYFGVIQRIDNIDLSDKIIVEDNVFFYDFKKSIKCKHWFGYNSYRKITPFADGSLIKTTIKINESLIQNKFPDFIEKKYEAKRIKYEYLNKSIHVEQKYLRLFQEGESLLDEQTQIYKISDRTIYELSIYNYDKAQNVSRKYFNIFYKEFASFCLNKNPLEYNFFVVKYSEVSNLRQYLTKHNIYLPVHWPESSQMNNLYGNLISIPLFSLYTMDEMYYLIKILKKYFKENTQNEK